MQQLGRGFGRLPFGQVDRCTEFHQTGRKPRIALGQACNLGRREFLPCAPVHKPVGKGAGVSGPVQGSFVVGHPDVIGAGEGNHGPTGQRVCRGREGGRGKEREANRDCKAGDVHDGFPSEWGARESVVINRKRCNRARASAT